MPCTSMLCSRLRLSRSSARPVTLLALWICVLLTSSGATSHAAAARGVTSRQVLEDFARPGREHASAPLWVWNDNLTEEQVRSTLRDLAGQKVLQVFVHPRPGLMTPYLSQDWFRLWKAALDEAAKLDMNVWIYDENSYPSGFAGGFVPQAMPEARGRGLHFREAESPPKAGEPGLVSDATVAVFLAKGSGFEDVTGKARSGGELPAGKYLVAEVRRAPDSPWHGGRSYVDLLYPGVTEKFLDVTLGAYKREVGSEFGKRIPGIFTDEPEILPAGGLPWTDDLPRVFEKRWGYPLGANLPSLIRPVGDYKRVRHDYYQTLLDLFIERWAKPYYERCAKEGLEFTGHYWEHEWPRCVSVPDNMAMSAWQQCPGIDILMNQYAEDTHAQFGNVRAVRELSSVASQLGRPRTLCEAYGAAGWELRFADMKRIADWLYVLGVNTLDEHLSYITIRGARKFDHPQSFSYHEPWWDAYHVRASYAARLSAALSQGDQIQAFLVLEPTTTAWLYQVDPTQAGRLEEIGARFQELLLRLERAQVEYDIGCEDIIARQGSVLVRRLKVGKRGYRAVIIPPLMENVNSATARLLEELTLEGGTVIVCGDQPSLVDGRPSASGGAPGELPYGWQRVAPEELPAALAKLASDGFAVERAPGDRGILFHHRRRLSDGEILFLVNTSDQAPSSGKVLSPARGVERWDIETGKAVPITFSTGARGVELPFDLPPCGSLLVFLSWEPREPAPARNLAAKGVAPAGPPAVRRLAPNVLKLDYVDVAAGGEKLERAYVYRAAQFAFQKNGMDRNPWDSAVQFQDELVTRKFPEGSGVKVAYRFIVETKVPESLFVVVERPDLYKIKLNGTELAAQGGSWWLDRSFGKIDARAAAKVGENTLELSASPFSIYHEIESAYVIGEFGVKPADSGFAIVPEAGLTLGPWKDQLLPLYGDAVAYLQDFELPADALPAPPGTYRVRLPSWEGSVARVIVNGQAAGYIEAPPYERGVTPHLRGGKNTIEVDVIGTLKNTLGPHHAGPGLGAAWPAMFHQAPERGPPAGREYAAVGYGLFAPFVLERMTEAPPAGAGASEKPARGSSR